MKYKISIFFLLATALLSLSCARQGGYVRIEGYAQGGTYSVIFNTDGVNNAPTEIRDSVEAILRKIDFTLSGYNKNSVLSRFNAGEVIVVDEMFAEIYSMGHVLSFHCWALVIGTAATKWFCEHWQRL